MEATTLEKLDSRVAEVEQTVENWENEWIKWDARIAEVKTELGVEKTIRTQLYDQIKSLEAKQKDDIIGLLDTIGTNISLIAGLRSDYDKHLENKYPDYDYVNRATVGNLREITGLRSVVYRICKGLSTKAFFDNRHEEQKLWDELMEQLVGRKDSTSAKVGKPMDIDKYCKDSDGGNNKNDD